MLYAILAVVLVILDQLTKYLTRANIPLGGAAPFLPGFLDFTYVQNTGAAFSILQKHTWLLTVISALVVLAICCLAVRGFFSGRLGRLSAALILAGGMGNLIDRAVFGYVTDMIRTLFITFPVFNVADCCITVGVPLLFLYLILTWRGEEKKEEKPDDADHHLPPDGQ